MSYKIQNKNLQDLDPDLLPTTWLNFDKTYNFL